MATLEDIIKEINESLSENTGPRNATADYQKKSGIMPEAMIDRLAEFLKGYGKNKFKVGDIVTAKADANLAWCGRPAVVVESLQKKTVKPQFNGEFSSQTFGRFMNIRVAYVLDNKQGDDCIACFWHEAHAFEYYDPKKHVE